MTAGREQDARETLRARIVKALGDTTCDHATEAAWPSCLECDADAVLALLPSPPATTGAGPREAVADALMNKPAGSPRTWLYISDRDNALYLADVALAALAAPSPPATDGDAAAAP